jgi:hypothetical protein
MAHHIEVLQKISEEMNERGRNFEQEMAAIEQERIQVQGAIIRTDRDGMGSNEYRELLERHRAIMERRAALAAGYDYSVQRLRVLYARMNRVIERYYTDAARHFINDDRDRDFHPAALDSMYHPAVRHRRLRSG